MSNQPPAAFNGHPDYAAQWRPSFPSIIPPTYPPNPEYTLVAQPPSSHPGQNSDYNMAALNGNSQIPGAGAPGFFFPPHLPFMGQFDPAQGPPFHPMPIPSFGYAPMPFAPPGSSDPAPSLFNAHGTDRGQPPGSGFQAQGTSNAADSNREEGEVSEGGRSFGTKKHAKTAKRACLNSASVTRYSDLEEGETVSTRSRSSSRSSSPYNPPLSVSADPAVVHRAIEMQMRDAPATTPADQNPPKSAAQLRIQAQGALLSLAPHNIRYHELVAEGIDPTILKRLYEEVGIKITASQSEKTTQAANVPGKFFGAPTSSPRQVEVAAPGNSKKHTPITVQAIASPASQTDDSKPMERKELIARMLAAKAAKASESKVALTETQTPANATPTPSSNGTSGKENGVSVRERNKAQTELARQRIEELKRQALLKRQQQAEQQAQQPTQSDKSAKIDQLAVLSEPTAAAVQHPLPVRPPVPLPTEAAGIPGLVMPGSQRDSGMLSPAETTPAIVVDSTPVSRATQRKRPRAADFDEPAAIPKRHSAQAVRHPGPAEKLIIDISDDESLYGDDEGENMDVDSSPEQGATPMVTLETTGPSLQKYSSTRASTSTPQGSFRPGDQDHIRKRESEIEAMRRKIAELEQKRKAKLAASRFESPRTLDDSGSSSSAAQSSAAEPDIAETSTAPSSGPRLEAGAATSISSFANRSNLIDFFSGSSVRILASLNVEQLASFRSNLLQLKDIESDFSRPDAENLLSGCREDIDRLLAAVFGGLDGGLQLLEELRNLSHETSALPLEHMDELHRQAKLKVQDLAVKEGTLVSSSHPVKQESIVTDICHSASSTISVPADPEEGVPLDALTPGQEAAVDSSESREYTPDVPANGIIADEDANSVDLTSSPSRSDSTGSAMDESVNGVSSGHGSFARDVDFAGVQASAADSAPATGVEEHMDTDNSDYPLPEEVPESVPEDDKAMFEHDGQGHESDRGSRDSSSESDAYEPPEPDSSAEEAESKVEQDDKADEAYSPPFSPAPPAPVEELPESPRSRDQPQAEETLTRARPGPYLSEPRRDFQIGIIDDQVQSSTSGQKFSPYVSPLRAFKAYRYHPTYAQDVSDGYRSLTYSHDIDTMKYFCPYEVAGGVCNDRCCDFQHFRDINLSDDKILIEMGAVREGQTEEEKETYLAGLKEIINEMRRDKVKEFSTVAAEIAAYRRRFLQDPSRVLPL
ncbi:uncharacterized protein N7498_010272 [Penicillium cinerascens]|uniref:Putative zinc-finger domain-containing protein n=1 Tax=Penicillium cinerascens TaxID=70096 RepID=A0A9W9M8R9_9EURO|nr:uncharacterized protein N7498_010272 [Penicillium cinerascens]KAJ5191287.1 hypothetical protein N7498_010272 [Penicillium cinerascens]